MTNSTQPNYGAPWSREDLDKVREMFTDGVSVPEIAKAVGRSKGGVFGRLVDMKLIYWDNQVKQYYKIVWLGK